MVGSLAVYLVALGLAGTAFGKDFTFINNRDDTICVGTQGNSGFPAPNNGGFCIDGGQQTQVTTDDSWQGRFWPRTGCTLDGNGGAACETGDCGGKLECNGTGGTPPATLAEFKLSDSNGQDFYDVSNVDGSNVPVEIQPVNKKVDPNDQYRCGVAGCTNDLNGGCPSEMQLTNSGGQVVGCKSACVVDPTSDQYCCRGDYDTKDTCITDDWALNSAKYFKDNCPGAYSYALDDDTSLFNCDDTAYQITFY